jgi:hypothetical protein
MPIVCAYRRTQKKGRLNLFGASSATILQQFLPSEALVPAAKKFPCDRRLTLLKWIYTLPHNLTADAKRRKTMRKTILLFAFFGLVGSLWADEPTAGTWKLNIAKSKLPASRVENIEEMIVVIRELDADTIEKTATETRKDGTASVTKWTVPRNGGFQTYHQGGPEKGVSIFSAIVDANTMYNVYIQDGKQVLLTPVKFSRDFKNYTISWTGEDAQGKPSEFLVFYEKQ